MFLLELFGRGPERNSALCPATCAALAQVPAENPPRLRVAGRDYVWKDGEGMMFDDSWPHEVINPSNEPRVVLIVDVPRPFPLVPRMVNRTVLWGLAAPLYGRKVVRRAAVYSGQGRGAA